MWLKHNGQPVAFSVVLNQATQPSFYPVSCEDLTKPRSKSCTKAGMIASSHVPKWNVESSGTSRKDVKEKARLFLFQEYIHTKFVPMLHSNSENLLANCCIKFCGNVSRLTFLAPPSMTQEVSRLASKKTRDPSASTMLSPFKRWWSRVECPWHAPRLANEIQAQNFEHPWLASPLVKKKCASMISAAQYR